MYLITTKSSNKNNMNSSNNIKGQHRTLGKSKQWHGVIIEFQTPIKTRTMLYLTIESRNRSATLRGVQVRIPPVTMSCDML